MKRTIIASFYTLLAGAFGLLLLASIVFSCRTGKNPHQTPSSGEQHTPASPEHTTSESGHASALDQLDLTTPVARSV